MQADRVSAATHWPRQVLILGGGRWARVVAEVLVQLLPPTHGLTLCSPRGADLLTAWARQPGFAGRVNVLADRPTAFEAGFPPAVLVVNAARDHISSARWALATGATVLIEKPASMTLAALEQLVGEPAARDRLFAAHVFRFANYFSSLRQRIARARHVHSFRVIWEDAAGEVRNGEAKKYDASVPILHDCMPHVVSILQALTDQVPSVAGPVEVEQGGARVRLALRIADLPCEVILARNARRRARVVVVQTDLGEVTLDFTAEPGVIDHAGVQVAADTAWLERPRPLASLLRAFLDAAGGGWPDPRLALSTAVETCRLVDACADSYQDGLIKALERAYSLGEADLVALDYGLAELLQASGPWEPERLAQRLTQMRVTLQDARPGAFADALHASLAAGRLHPQAAHLTKEKFI